MVIFELVLLWVGYCYFRTRGKNTRVIQRRKPLTCDKHTQTSVIDIFNLDFNMDDCFSLDSDEMSLSDLSNETVYELHEDYMKLI